jgi:acetylornithine deacetylase
MKIDEIKLAKELIAINSNCHRSNLEIAAFVGKLLEDIGFAVKRVNYIDRDGQSKVNLIAKKGSGKGGFGIFCHSDTVPPGEGQWEPFKPVIEKGRLIGLGSCDMKGALAAAIAAGSNINPNSLCAPFYLIITADEEKEMTGARKLISDSKTLMQNWPDFGVIGEPTNLKPIHAHKGAERIFVTAYGKSAHTSTGKGISSNFLIAPFLAEMAMLADVFKKDKRFLNYSFDPPTNGFNMVINDGGCNPNVTASKTVCTISLRNMPDDNHDDAVDMILRCAEKFGLEADHYGVKPFYISPESEIVRVALEVSECDRSETACYGTEALFLQSHLQLVILGPGNIAQAHTVGEWVEIDQLRRAVQIYGKLIERFCVA